MTATIDRQDAAAAALPAQTVALIHGLARSTGSMFVLARRLERAGFRTFRVGYPSRRLTIDAAVAHVGAEIMRRSDVGPIHLVGHSLGGVIAGELARRRPDLPIGRVVQLGAPNAGSGLAAAVARIPGARRLLGPALDEIAALPASTDPQPRIGAIAGRLRPAEALGRVVGLTGPNDGFVTVHSAWSGAGTRLAMASVHGWLPLSPATARAVAAFLASGRFGDDA